MTRAISQDDLRTMLPAVLAGVRDDTYLIQDESGEAVAALVPLDDYEVLRRARAEKAIASMRALGEHMQAAMTPAELDALEKELHERAR